MPIPWEIEMQSPPAHKERISIDVDVDESFC
jgi:hypothetical protein